MQKIARKNFPSHRDAATFLLYRKKNLLTSPSYLDKTPK